MSAAKKLSIQSLRAEIEARLSVVLGELEPVSPLREAAQYSVLNGGKRIRPILCCVLSSDLGQDPTLAVQPALALEFLHCASLIHDDLPALDNDDYRRGKPSCHKQFGEATAILAGDLLIGLAFKALAGPSKRPAIEGRLVSVLSSALVDLCLGQQLDLTATSDSKDDIARMHRLKTGALFVSAAEFAGLIANVDEAQLSDLRTFGVSLGGFFQLADDYIDRFTNFETRGRPTSSDERNQKQNSVTGLTERESLELVLGAYSGLESKLKELLGQDRFDLSLSQQLLTSLRSRLELE